MTYGKVAMELYLHSANVRQCICLYQTKDIHKCSKTHTQLGGKQQGDYWKQGNKSTLRDAESLKGSPCIITATFGHTQHTNHIAKLQHNSVSMRHACSFPACSSGTRLSRHSRAAPFRRKWPSTHQRYRRTSNCLLGDCSLHPPHPVGTLRPSPFPLPLPLPLPCPCPCPCR